MNLITIQFLMLALIFAILLLISTNTKIHSLIKLVREKHLENSRVFSFCGIIFSSLISIFLEYNYKQSLDILWFIIPIMLILFWGYNYKKAANLDLSVSKQRISKAVELMIGSLLQNTTSGMSIEEIQNKIYGTLGKSEYLISNLLKMDGIKELLTGILPDSEMLKNILTNMSNIELKDGKYYYIR